MTLDRDGSALREETAEARAGHRRTRTVGVLAGAVVGALPEHGVVDAPVRDARFARAGRAATSVQGQEPGSPVEPDYAPDADDERRPE